MNKPLRVATVAFIVGFTMLLQPPNAFAAVGFADITCQDPDTGEQQTFYRGWDNFNQFFADKGNIPQFFCEGGFAGSYTIYISDSLAADSPQRYYAGILPTPLPSEPPPIEPTPIPEPVVTPSDTPMPTPTPEPSPSSTPEPVPSVVTNEPSLAPVVPPVPPIGPTPTQTPTAAPTPSLEPPAIQSAPPVEALPPPPLAPDPPSLNPQEVVLEVPTQLLAIPGFEELAKSVEAIMNIGSDMTPQQREESQAVVISAVLVGQIATSIRRIK